MADQTNDVRKIDELGPTQHAALELLVTGNSVAEAARTAGVSRVTIYKWIQNDPVFSAAYNQWQQEVAESCRSRLTTLTEKASRALEIGLEKGDAKAALQLLKGMGLIKPAKKGATDPEERRREMDVERKMHLTKLDRSERGAEIYRLNSIRIDKDAMEMATDNLNGPEWEATGRKVVGEKVVGKWRRVSASEEVEKALREKFRKEEKKEEAEEGGDCT